ncbi:GntR family transcriptional regulator [uncultured Jannaschia sp.]|uniref:GntR family transcriptional regulator n=1 Tax=uncultured Jannaschia sp. TaxID=293347 RepID=UPI002614299E|nr:GntR family transcriptional regulator [uncultured Jannaschia sp.]
MSMLTKAQVSIGISLVEKIRADILTAKLKPGEKLTVKMLSKMNDCGASPIREALNQLTSDGLVLRIDRRGFFVSSISREEFEDILFNRCFLESEALRRSIELGGPDWEERVLIAHYRLNRHEREIDGPDGPVPNPDWEIAHKQFHLDLLSACGSSILLGNCAKLHALNNRYRFFARSAPGRARTVSEEHTRLRDFALSRNLEEAIKALVDHYRKTGEAVFQAKVTSLSIVEADASSV